MSELLHYRGEGARRLVDTVRERLIRRDSRHPHGQKARIVAVGRSVDGGAFVVTAPTATTETMSLEKVFSEASASQVQIRFDVTAQDCRVLYKPLAWRTTEGKWVTLTAETIDQAELDATVTAAGWQMDLLPTHLIYPELMYSFKKA